MGFEFATSTLASWYSPAHQQLTWHAPPSQVTENTASSQKASPVVRELCMG